jgi:hypothetical protein
MSALGVRSAEERKKKKNEPECVQDADMDDTGELRAVPGA